jgi:hypothetical protein
MCNQKAVNYTVLLFYMLALDGLFKDVLVVDAPMERGRAALSL